MRGEPPRTRAPLATTQLGPRCGRARARSLGASTTGGDPGCYNTPEDCVSFGGGRKSRELDSTMLLTDLHLAAVEEPAEENNGLSSSSTWFSLFSFFK